MLEILVLAIVALATMARKGSARRHPRYRLRPVRITPDLALATLGTKTVLATGFTGAADGPYRIISATCIWSLLGLTIGDGPITVGYAHSDYSVTEIKEYIEGAAQINVGNLVSSREQAQRFIRIVGTMPGNPAGSLGMQALNDGNPIKTRLNWPMPVGKFVNLFAYNDGQQLTTGAILSPTGTLWVKDGL